MSRIVSSQAPESHSIAICLIGWPESGPFHPQLDAIRGPTSRTKYVVLTRSQPHQCLHSSLRPRFAMRSRKSFKAPSRLPHSHALSTNGRPRDRGFRMGETQSRAGLPWCPTAMLPSNNSWLASVAQLVRASY